MDGSGVPIHIVEAGLGGADISLFYDQELHRIFWTDPHNEEISSATIDGKRMGLKLFTTAFRKLIYPCKYYWINLAQVEFI
jgi:hypothetical protein